MTTPTLTPDDIGRLADCVRELARLDERLCGSGDVGFCVRSALIEAEWALAHADGTTEAAHV